MPLTDDNMPATNGELRLVKSDLQSAFQELLHQFQSLKAHMDQQFGVMNKQFEVIISYMGTLATKEELKQYAKKSDVDDLGRQLLMHDEQMRDDIFAYIDTKFGSLGTKVTDHEVRIQNLEAVRR